MIPKHDEIELPALELLQDGTPRRTKELEKPLASRFKLTEQDLGRMYDSGNGPIFFDRIAWALSYLSMAGLVDKPKRGVYRINDSGLKILKRPDQLRDFVQAALAERDRLKKKIKKESSSAEAEEGTASDLTPQERLYESYAKIRQSVYEDILDTILSKSPLEFEHLVVELLEKMGYGGQVEEAGKVTTYTNDGGIDGVIKEDVLGLGRIHIQAKRYRRDKTVGRQEIQKFVGALAVAQSNKGVFITTSTYSRGAEDYANSLHGNTMLVLIDGPELAKLIYDFGLGMQVEQTIKIKKLDSDYWDSKQDD